MFSKHESARDSLRENKSSGHLDFLNEFFFALFAYGNYSLL